jgi:hypothetical protein
VVAIDGSPFKDEALVIIIGLQPSYCEQQRTISIQYCPKKFHLQSQ